MSPDHRPLDHERLTRITRDALERSAFMFAEPACDDTGSSPPASTPALHALVSYEGPSSGCVAVAADEAFARELAAGLLGVDPDEVSVEGEGLDALRELANVLGGCVLRELGAEALPFHMHVPQLACPAPCPHAVVSRLLVDGSTLVVSWRPDRRAA